MHEDRARLVDGRLDGRAGRGLVVERGERETFVGCLDQHTGQDRLGFQRGRSLTTNDTASLNTSRFT